MQQRKNMVSKSWTKKPMVTTKPPVFSFHIHSGPISKYAKIMNIIPTILNL